jgi:regulation of enolase protein 1 (concanavalin A-like superfamily)
MVRSSLTALGVCLLLGSTIAQETKSDTVAGWGTLTDPDSDCRVKESNGALTITIPNKHHNLTHTTNGSKLNSPRVLQDVKGDFRLQVKVPIFPLPGANTSSDKGYSFVSAGLLIWHDEKNFVRMDRAAEGNSGGGPFAWVEVFRDGKPVTQKLRRLEDKDTHLRITRTGDYITFEAGDDGKSWAAVHAGEVKLPVQVKAGVFAINTTTKEFAPRLAGLTLRPK